MMDVDNDHKWTLKSLGDVGKVMWELLTEGPSKNYTHVASPTVGRVDIICLTMAPDI